MVLSIWWALSCISGTKTVAAALATKRSQALSSLAAASKRRSMEPSWVWSACTETSLRHSFATSSANFSAVWASRRQETARSQPLAASRSPMARPIPLVPPVMTATFMAMVYHPCPPHAHEHGKDHLSAQPEDEGGPDRRGRRGGEASRPGGLGLRRGLRLLDLPRAGAAGHGAPDGDGGPGERPPRPRL